MKAVVLAYHDVGVAGLEAAETAGSRSRRSSPIRMIPARTSGSDQLPNGLQKPVFPLMLPEDINHPIWIERRARKPTPCFPSTTGSS